MVRNEKYQVIKHHFPGTNIVKLVLLHGALKIWRPLNGQRGTGLAEYEVVAFRISEALKLDIVPQTDFRMLDHVPGVLQDYMDGVDGYSWDDIAQHKAYNTPEYCRMLILDYLIGNQDRYDWHCISAPGATEKWRLWSVDHTNIFQYATPDIDKLRAGLSHSVGASVLVAVSKVVDMLLLKSIPIKRLSTLIGEYAPAEARAEFEHRLNVIAKGIKE